MLEDRVQVGLDAVIDAGVRVGSESIVASSSYVVTIIPSGNPAIGVPARVSGNARRTLSPHRRDALVARLVEEPGELLALGGHAVEEVDVETRSRLSRSLAEQTSHAAFAPRVDGDFDVPTSPGETVVPHPCT